MDEFKAGVMTRNVAQRLIDHATYREFTGEDSNNEFEHLLVTTTSSRRNSSKSIGGTDNMLEKGETSATTVAGTGTSVGGDKCVLYRTGERADVYTLVLQGSVSVVTATDNLAFEMGPFSSLAAQVRVDSCSNFCLPCEGVSSSCARITYVCSERGHGHRQPGL